MPIILQAHLRLFLNAHCALPGPSTPPNSALRSSWGRQRFVLHIWRMAEAADVVGCARKLRQRTSGGFSIWTVGLLSCCRVDRSRGVEGSEASQLAMGIQAMSRHPRSCPLAPPQADCSSLPVNFGPDPPRMQLQLLILSDGSLTRHLQILSGTAPLLPPFAGPLLALAAESNPPLTPATGSPVEVAVLAEETVSLADCGASGPDPGVPAECALIGPTLVQRQVVLRRAGGGAGERPMAYAASWWSEEAYRSAILETGKARWGLGAPGARGCGVRFPARDLHPASSRLRPPHPLFPPLSPQPIWLNLAASRTETLREMKRVYRGRNAQLERVLGLPVRGGHTCSGGEAAEAARCRRARRRALTPLRRRASPPAALRRRGRTCGGATTCSSTGGRCSRASTRCGGLPPPRRASAPAAWTAAPRVTAPP